MSDTLKELTELVDKYIGIKAERDALKVKDKLLVVDQQEAEAQLSSLMLVADMPSMTRNGPDGRKYTVYTRRELGVKSLGGDTAAIVSALRKISGDLIGISHPKLKAYVKEKMTDPVTGDWELRPEKLPKSLREVCEVSETSKIGLTSKAK